MISRQQKLLQIRCGPMCSRDCWGEGQTVKARLWMNLANTGPLRSACHGLHAEGS